MLRTKSTPFTLSVATWAMALAPRKRSAPSSPSTAPDRKSTRLNSSHSQISYAVFCLKKKKKNKHSPSVSMHFQTDVVSAQNRLLQFMQYHTTISPYHIYSSVSHSHTLTVVSSIPIPH